MFSLIKSPPLFNQKLGDKHYWAHIAVGADWLHEHSDRKSTRKCVEVGLFGERFFEFTPEVAVRIWRI